MIIQNAIVLVKVDLISAQNDEFLEGDREKKNQMRILPNSVHHDIQNRKSFISAI